MEKLKKSHNVQVTWHAYELRPPGSPPIPPEYKAKIEAARPRMVAMAREHYGIEMNPGTVSGTSRTALIGAKFAETQGLGEAYNNAVLEAYWQDGRDIGDVAVLQEIAVEVGLAGGDFMPALSNPLHEQAVLQDVQQAYQYGLNGVPALIFANKYLVSGAQPYETLVQVVEQVAAES